MQLTFCISHLVAWPIRHFGRCDRSTQPLQLKSASSRIICRQSRARPVWLAALAVRVRIVLARNQRSYFLGRRLAAGLPASGFLAPDLPPRADMAFCFSASLSLPSPSVSKRFIISALRSGPAPFARAASAIPEKASPASSGILSNTNARFLMVKLAINRRVLQRQQAGRETLDIPIQHRLCSRVQRNKR